MSEVNYRRNDSGWCLVIGAWCLVIGGWCEGAEVEPRAAGGEEGEVI